MHVAILFIRYMWLWSNVFNLVRIALQVTNHIQKAKKAAVTKDGEEMTLNTHF